MDRITSADPGPPLTRCLSGSPNLHQPWFSHLENREALIFLNVIIRIINNISTLLNKETSNGFALNQSLLSIALGHVVHQ